MIKWLFISLFVLSIFLLFLLGFGVLLYDNEKQHESYNRQLLNEKLQQYQSDNTSESFAITSVPIVHPENKQRKKSTSLSILANNLTCVANDQCMVVEIDFVDLTCTVAVNQIGEAQLKKIEQDETMIGRCENRIHESNAVCVNNFCTLAPTN
jgi:hypothetical protein